MVPYLLLSLSESTAGMPARACWAAAGAGGAEQTAGEREGGVQEGERGLGQTMQRARVWHQQTTGWAETESGDDPGDGEKAEGGVQRFPHSSLYLCPYRLKKLKSLLKQYPAQYKIFK